MKAAVLHINAANYDAETPTMMIARFVAEELKLPLIHDEATARQHLKTKFDVLFVKLGVLLFCAHRDLVMEIYANAKRIINLENDCTFAPDSRLIKANASYEVWTTVPSNAVKYGGRSINWNRVAWVHSRPTLEPIIPGLFYYGAFKKHDAPVSKRYFSGTPGREEDLRRYLSVPPTVYPVTVSCYGRNKKLFEEVCPEATILPRMKLDELWKAETTLYLEDEYSHQVYSSPGQRFYECLQHGVAIAVDSKCVSTFKEAGYHDVEDHVVNGPEDLARFMDDWGWHGSAQMNCWYRNYREELRSELHALVKKEFGSNGLK